MKEKIVEMQKRIYIPRTKVSIGTLIICEHIKREKGIKSLGKAMELLWLESSTFNAMLDELKQNPDWKHGDFSTPFINALKQI